MLPIVLTSAAWYTIPKGIEYLITDCETEPQSKIEYVRKTLFNYKSALEGVVYANALTKFAYKALQIPYAHMWIAVLIAPGLKQVLPFKSPVDQFLQIAICYSLFSCKYFLKSFIKSSRGVGCMISPGGIRILNTGIGLDFIERSFYEDSRNNAVKQMRKVLELRLEPSDASAFLRARGRENLLSVVERVRCYKSNKEVSSLLGIINDRFSVIEEDWLESLPSQVREKLLDASGLVDNRSVLDCLTHKVSSIGDLSGEWHNSVYARAIIDLRINPQQYDPQEIEMVIMAAFPIPAAFHEDLTLRSYICPITHKPIRYPVEDPTNYRQEQGNPILYERAAIIDILGNSPVSPVTQKPLTIDQLIPRQDIQDVIEMRLDRYSSNIWCYLETNPFS